MAKYAEAAPLILKALENGDSNNEAARKAGVSYETFKEWQRSKPAFSAEVKRARENGRENAIFAVESALLDVTKGFEYEEVRTEYESKPNPDPRAKEKYIPTIKKQVRTKKRVIANVEAIKFFLTNKAPQEWKNRQEHEIANLDLLKDLHIKRIKDGDDKPSGLIAHSEDEVQD